jgi:hypothetical protein
MNYYVDSLSGETFEDNEFSSDDYGVFSEEKEGHCYFHGSKIECQNFIKNAQ